MIVIEVNGAPAPQGSKRGFVHPKTGKVVLLESSRKVEPWRDAVRTETQRAMALPGAGAPLEGPVELTLMFRLTRPQSAPRRVLWPAKQPDIDKLARAVMDGLTAGGLWHDDAQAVDLRAVKQFAADGSPAGCLITARTMDEVLELSKAAPDQFETCQRLTKTPQDKHPEGLPF